MLLQIEPELTIDGLHPSALGMEKLLVCLKHNLPPIQRLHTHNLYWRPFQGYLRGDNEYHFLIFCAPVKDGLEVFHSSFVHQLRRIWRCFLKDFQRIHVASSLCIGLLIEFWKLNSAASSSSVPTKFEITPTISKNGSKGQRFENVNWKWVWRLRSHRIYCFDSINALILLFRSHFEVGIPNGVARLYTKKKDEEFY